MSRTAKTHIRQHGKEKLELLHDHNVPLAEQHKAFKALRAESVNEKIAEVHYQESDGPLRVIHFISSAEKKAREEADAKSIAEAKKASEAAEKEKAKAAEEKRRKEAEEAKARIEADKKAREERRAKKA